MTKLGRKKLAQGFGIFMTSLICIGMAFLALKHWNNETTPGLASSGEPTPQNNAMQTEIVTNEQIEKELNQIADTKLKEKQAILAAEKRVAEEQLRIKKAAEQKAAQEAQKIRDAALKKEAQEKKALEEAKQAKAAAEKAAQDKVNDEKAAEALKAKMIAKKKADAEAIALKEKQEKLKQEQAKQAQAQIEKEKLEKEKAEKDRLAKEAATKAANQKIAQEKAAKEKAAQEKMAQEKAAQEKAANEAAAKAAAEKAQAAANKAKMERGLEGYSDLVRDQVFGNWSLHQDAGDLKAIVLIKVDINGNIQGKPKLVQSSGNTLFDDSCLTAALKSSPLRMPTEPLSRQEVVRLGGIQIEFTPKR